MALKEPQFRSSGDPMEESDAEELEELEADVKDMAQNLLHYRTTLPVQLKSTFTSILSVQRPPFLEFISGSDLEAAGESDSGERRVLLAQGDYETSEKIQLLKQKISRNPYTVLHACLTASIRTMNLALKILQGKELLELKAFVVA